MDQERFAYLFQRYVEKNCSAVELDELMGMLRDPQQSYNMEFVLDNIWESSAEVTIDRNKSEQILNKVWESDVSFVRKDKFLRLKTWLGWAAAVVIIGIAALLLVNPPKKEQQAAAVNTAEKTHQPALSITPVTVRTTNEHQKVTLPDGSTVILNNNSSLTYPVAFARDKREISLTGEGYFDISHDAEKSFTVYTGKIKTTVLGTAFNIKAYDKDENITVTVTRGKVSVLGDKAVLSIVTPNQQIVFNKDYQKYSVAKVVAKNSIQWQQSDLFFDDISMEQAAQILADQFNTPITFENNKVAKCRFTATFLRGERLNEILKVICSYNNAQYESGAGGITIKGNGCEQ